MKGTKVLHKGFFIEDMEQLSAVKFDCIDEEEDKFYCRQCRWLQRRGDSSAIPAEFIREAIEVQVGYWEISTEDALVHKSQHAPPKWPVR